MIYNLYTTVTKNGSPVEIKEWSEPGTAWTQSTLHRVFFVKLNEIDLPIQLTLDVPNWCFDYTGKGLTLQAGKLDWGVTKAHFDSLEIQDNWVKQKPNQ